MLDPVIHQPNRLQILATLYRNRAMAFGELRDSLGLTAGNLGAHVSRLEEAGYVRRDAVLAGLNFEVHYRITEEGMAAFRAYLAALRALLASLPAEEPAEGSGPEAP